MAEKAYRGVLKARISKLYGGDVTIEKAKKLKARSNATPRDKQLANWFINMQTNRPSPGKMSDSPFQMKGSPLQKQKGGGTKKVCLPIAKIRSMSKEEREKLVRAKQAAGAKGKYRRSPKTNVKGARKPKATLRDWFEKEDWRRVDDPSKKCGE
jgi:hypothetical protein